MKTKRRKESEERRKEGRKVIDQVVVIAPDGS
jgi:hypothetical protein